MDSKYFREGDMKRIVVFILSIIMIFSMAPLSETAYAAQEAEEKPIETAADLIFSSMYMTMS